MESPVGVTTLLKDASDLSTVESRTGNGSAVSSFSNDSILLSMIGSSVSLTANKSSSLENSSDYSTDTNSGSGSGSGSGSSVSGSSMYGSSFSESDSDSCESLNSINTKVLRREIAKVNREFANEPNERKSRVQSLLLGFDILKSKKSECLNAGGIPATGGLSRQHVHFIALTMAFSALTMWGVALYNRDAFCTV